MLLLWYIAVAMKYRNFSYSRILGLVFYSFFIAAMVGCRTSDQMPTSRPVVVTDGADEQTIPPPQAGNVTPEGGYPGPTNAGISDYPGPATIEGLVATPPDPERSLPRPQAETGTVGGVLIREITDHGFVPLTPYELILGSVILDSQGRPALLGYDDTSQRAETFPTGIFVFSNVPPGNYGLIVNMGFTQFPVTGDDGGELVITVEEGSVLDLGQVIVQLPGM
jgi:hypothetical protein